MMRGRGWEGCWSRKGASAGGDVIGGVEVGCEGEGDVTGIVGD